MRKYLRIGVSALALSTFVVAPTVLVLSADVVQAKNGGGNGNGGGKGGGNGGDKGGGNGGDKGGKGGHKSSDKGAGKSKIKGEKAGSRRAGKSSHSGSVGKQIKSDFKELGAGIKGLFKKKDKTTKQASRPTKQAKQPVQSAKQPTRQVAAVKEKGVLHPSNLGKLNGMINSSPNAKLAHMRNGNFNGTVGVAAAMALAEYEYRVAEMAYEDALGVIEDPEIAAQLEAFDLIEGAPTPEEVAAAQEVLDAEDADPESDAYKQAEAIVNYPDTTAAEALVEGVDEQALRDEVAGAQETVDQGPPDDGDVIASQQAVLDTYKGDLAVEDEETVLNEVRTGFPTDDEIAAAVPAEEVEDIEGADGAEEIEDEDVVEDSEPENEEEELVLAQDN